MCHLYSYNNVKLLRKFFFTLIIVYAKLSGLVCEFVFALTASETDRKIDVENPTYKKCEGPMILG